MTARTNMTPAIRGSAKKRSDGRDATPSIYLKLN